MFKNIPILLVSPVLASLLQDLEDNFQIHKLWLTDNPNDFLKETGPSIKGVVSTFAHGVSDDLMAQLPNLEMIASYGVGLDRINLKTVKKRSIAISNTPDIQEPVADLAIALLLTVTRKICQADRYTREGEWIRSAFPLSTSLQDKTCGIVAMGRIGQAIAKRAEAFGLNIAYYGPNQKDVPYRYFNDLEALAKESDFLILALPGGKETHHIINARILDALGPTGYLINIARGSVVDETALIESLKAGKIAGAGLDVFEVEPLGDSPLFEMENVVVVPHIASATNEMRKEMGNVVIANLKAHFSNQPLVTPVPL